MSTLLSEKVTALAADLVEVRARVRAALAAEFARAVGVAVRDVLAPALGGRSGMPSAFSSPSATPGVGWRGGPGPLGPRDPWDEPDEFDERPPARSSRTELEADLPAGPIAATVGLAVWRWWRAGRGTTTGAARAGLAAAALTLVAGPATLAVLAVVADLLAANTTLAPHDRS